MEYVPQKAAGIRTEPPLPSQSIIVGCGVVSLWWQTDLYPCPNLRSYLARLGVLLPLHHALTPAARLERNVNSTGLPPEEPPQESSWFTGFNVVPIILFTVSPSWEHQGQWMNAQQEW